MADQTAQKSMTVPLTAFAVGAVVALLVGFFGRALDPTQAGTTTLGYDSVIDMKTVVAIPILVLAVVQLLGALSMYARFGREAPSWVAPAHRAVGTITLLLTAFVAYHCLRSLGLQVGTLPDGGTVPARTVVHGLLGCAVVGAAVVKLVAVRSRRAAGWFLPVAGGLLFSLLVLAVLTSAVWYLAEEGWPSRSG